MCSVAEGLCEVRTYLTSTKANNVAKIHFLFIT